MKVKKETSRYQIFISKIKIPAKLDLQKQKRKKRFKGKSNVHQ